MKNTAILIQARMSSQRCPKKILADLNGRPLIIRILESLERNHHGVPVIVCTSEEASDDPVEELCKREGKTFFRGSLNDVASRFIDTCQQFELEHLVRISGDSPWFNVQLVDRIMESYFSSEVDLCCNVHPRSFPKGQSLEMFSLQLLEKFYSDMDENDREHVTPIFYRHAEDLNIGNLHFSSPSNHLDLSIDTPEQLKICQEQFKKLERPHWDYSIEEILSLHNFD